MAFKNNVLVFFSDYAREASYEWYQKICLIILYIFVDILKKGYKRTPAVKTSKNLFEFEPLRTSQRAGLNQGASAVKKKT